MKPLIISILILIITFQSYISFSQVWPKYFGEPGKYDFSKDIIEAYDIGYLICGNIHVYGNETVKNGWLIKTDINGAVLWEKVFDSDLHLIYISAIEQTNDGGILICGLINPNLSYADPFVIKLNSCGEKEWCKQFAGANNSTPSAPDIKETGSGEIILLVNEWGNYPEETMHLFKLSAEGDVIWKKPYCNGYIYPEAALPFGNKVIITSQNNYLISGDVYWEDPWNPGGPKALRPLFVMVDNLGVEKWVLPYGLSDTIHGTGDNIIQISNEHFAGIGSYWTNQVYVEPLFMKFDQNGNELDYQILYTSEITSELVGGSFQYSKLINSLFYTGGGFIFPDNLGYPIMEASLQYDSLNFSFIPLLNRIDEENSDPYTLNKTSDNKLLSNSTFKETGNWDIVLSKLNLNLEYDTAYSGNYTYDSLCIPGPPQSGFIYLDDCDIITGIDIPSPEEYYAHLQTIPITVYPNPTNNRVTFAMENTEHHKNITLKCFNLLGKQVFQTSVIAGQKETSTVVSAWPQGMYVAVMYSDGMPVGQCKFVVQ